MPTSSGPLRLSDSDSKICSAALEESFPPCLPSGTLKRLQSHYLPLTPLSWSWTAITQSPIRLEAAPLLHGWQLPTRQWEMKQNKYFIQQKKYLMVTSEFLSCGSVTQLLHQFNNWLIHISRTLHWARLCQVEQGAWAAESGSRDTEEASMSAPPVRSWSWWRLWPTL